MKKKILERNSNFELLRIASMILIILYHFTVHNSISYSNNNFLVGFLNVGGKLGVVLFAMITGYYMYSKEKVSFKKVICLEGQALFYSIGIFIVFSVIDNKYFSAYKLMMALCPNIFKTYWFFSSYFILYLCIPYLNKLIRVLSRDEFRRLLVILFVFIVLVPSLAVGNSKLTEGIYLFYYYLIGGYISKYIKSIKVSNFKYLVVVLVSFILMVVCNYYYNRLKLNSFNVFVDVNPYSWTSSVFIFLCAISLFMFFRNLKIENNKYINWLASGSFGVYLFHEHFFMRDLLWNNLFTYNKVLGGNILFNLVVMVVLIYLIGSMIELIRKCIFKYFYCKMGFSGDV